MQLHYYHLLQDQHEPVGDYKKRLESFAILNRFERPRNYVNVAEQIVKRNLTTQFNHYRVSPERW